MKYHLRTCLRSLVSKILEYRPDRFPPDLTEEEKSICVAVADYTMTSIERIVCLIRATKYICVNSIAGDFVECGVWRGGSMMVVAHTLQSMGDTSRKLYLYDTFTGMLQPTKEDKRFDGIPADQLLNASDRDARIWCYADKQDVARNLLSTGYPESRIVLVEGKVEDTIPQTLPSQICLLRLDTDWYNSTKHELTHLYPIISKNGVLIIDDYGHWQGVKQATDEYFNQFPIKPFLQRVDYAGRVTVKMEETMSDGLFR